MTTTSTPDTFDETTSLVREAEALVRARPWTVAASAFALGVAGGRLLRSAGRRTGTTPADPNATDERALEADADDRTYATAYESFAPSPTPPEAARESLERQSGFAPETNHGA